MSKSETADRLLDELRAYIAENGMKSSRQRELIAGIFFESGDHLRVEELVERVREKEPGIGQATVYRTMKLLTQCGLAEAHQFADGHVRYEMVAAPEAHHDHIICGDCGRIVEFFDEELEAHQVRIATDQGFELRQHRMELYGKCVTPNCEYRN